MNTPREQDVLAQMNLVDGLSIEPVCDLLVSLGYEDVARELRRRWEEINDADDGMY